jgi:cytochrome c oxidase cbb3-type subunit 3
MRSIKIWLTAGAVVALAVALVSGQTPPQQGRAGGRGGGQGTPATPPRGGGGGGGLGPSDKPAVDAEAADRGRRVWASECITCHGTQARGTDSGPNLVRSVLVLHDRFGSELGPFLKKGHKTQSGTPSAGLTDAQVVDLANFLRQRVNETLRQSPTFTVQNILTGDPAAGAAYFNGDGKCTTCHSVTGDLAGIASRYPAPVDVQQRMLFPSGGRGGGQRGAAPAAAPAAPGRTAITVTLTPASGAPMSGVLVQKDDFFVTYRDASGTVHIVRRTPALKVTITDPLQAHHELLDRISDKNIHDLAAYLMTLK